MDLYQKQLEKSDDMKFKSIVTEVHKFLIPLLKTYQRYVWSSSYFKNSGQEKDSILLRRRLSSAIFE